jgi:hypothetical protein
MKLCFSLVVEDVTETMVFTSDVKLVFLFYISEYSCVRFDVFTKVTMKNGVFWDVTPCGSCKNRRFG